MKKVIPPLLIVVSLPLCAAEDFAAQLKPLLAHIKDAEKFVVHVAYGRNETPPPEAKVLKMKGYDFHHDASEISAKESVDLRAIFSEAATYRKWRKAKGCGGYFPSLCAAWTKGEQTVHALICFSCDEVKLYKGDEVLYCDLNEAGCKDARKILDRLKFPINGIDD